MMRGHMMFVPSPYFVRKILGNCGMCDPHTSCVSAAMRFAIGAKQREQRRYRHQRARFRHQTIDGHPALPLASIARNFENREMRRDFAE